MNDLKKALEEKVSKALIAAANQLIADCDEVFNEPRTWEAGFGTTQRKNGEIVVGSHRNIVDTGELRDSATVYDNQPLSKTVSWEAEHAEMVYFGEHQKPPRKWVDYGLREENLIDAFIEEFNK